MQIQYENVGFSIHLFSCEPLKCILNSSIADYGLSSNARKITILFTLLDSNLSKAFSWSLYENKCDSQQMKSKYLSVGTC